ncbi:MAG: slipin family protein [Alphaproteobacteria bacterium]|nr:slipin family protein [Alphaproteobacteria bacterium]
MRRLTTETFKVVRGELGWDRYATIASVAPKAAADNFVAVQTQASEVAIVSFDGQPTHLMAPWQTRAFWKGVSKIEVERIDAKASLRIDKAHLARLDLAKANPMVSQAIVEAHETALVFVDGAFVERVGAGRHAFWNVDRTVKVQKLDLRPQALEITAQEILTKDRVSVRVTLTAFWKIVDPQKVVDGSTDVAQTLYKVAQFAIREAVAARTLDDILAARDRLDAELRESVAKRTSELGVVVDELGVKDVILPGEIRELINKVVEAERTAKANLIRRQEETAATRSLANTAKLMEDNKLLLRLKELESLEKLVEKVGRIDLHAGQGQGLEAILKGLFRLEGDKAV